MRYLGILFIALLTMSCSDQSTDIKLKNLEGYWNIEKVEKPDGEMKEFPFTDHMDYFHISGQTGTKTRVSPRFNGTFTSYGETVGFVWEERDNQLVLNFEKGEKAYSQILREATDKKMVLVHEDGTVYHYLVYTIDEK